MSRWRASGQQDRPDLPAVAWQKGFGEGLTKTGQKQYALAMQSTDNSFGIQEEGAMDTPAIIERLLVLAARHFEIRLRPDALKRISGRGDRGQSCCA